MSAQQPVPAHPVEFTAKSDPNFKVPPQLEAEIDELISHYPAKRSASRSARPRRNRRPHTTARPAPAAAPDR